VAFSGFASKLNDLAMSSHVWVVRTAATEEVARRIWEKQFPDEWDLYVPAKAYELLEVKIHITIEPT